MVNSSEVCPMNAAPNKKSRYASKEVPKSFMAKWGGWIFIVVGIVAIIGVIWASPRQKNLVCNSAGQTSLIGFGSCTEE
ncbi:MAG: hypothetical protein JO126_03345 [Alphaproteobacteria bacterium]|nr:hypothetical protein [Alphaproteobacteria bacterium]MBV8548473.1 hypothetical protein [Alphaproteobacteria bacterium]